MAFHPSSFVAQLVGRTTIQQYLAEKRNEEGRLRVKGEDDQAYSDQRQYGNTEESIGMRNAFQQQGQPVSLLLRLVNETYISLPVTSCEGVKQAGTLSDKISVTPAIIHKTEACSIDWSGAKILQSPLATSGEILARNATSESKNQPAAPLDRIVDFSREFTLPNLENYQQDAEMRNHHRQENHLGESHIATSLNYTATPTTTGASDYGFFGRESPLNYNVTRMTYLSLSSLLSICGIIANLIIILIIVFRVKQKCNNSISRSSSSTNRTSLLLVQLTLTGFLLASYILIDNIQLYNQTAGSLPLMRVGDDIELRDYVRHGCSSDQEFSLCRVVAQAPSPLSTFLPPTPFHGTTASLPAGRRTPDYNCDLNSEAQIPLKSNSGQLGKTEAPSEKKLALLLKFKVNDSLLFLEDAIESRAGSSYLSISSSRGSTRKIVDLSELIDSFYIVNSDCRNLDGSRASIDFKRTKQAPAACEEPLPSNRNEDQWGLLSRLIPLAMNVIASIHLWTVAALAYDRYSAIAHPLQYLRSIHAAKIRTFFVTIWVVSVTLNLILPLSLYMFEALTQRQYGQATSSCGRSQTDYQWQTLTPEVTLDEPAAEVESFDTSSEFCHYTRRATTLPLNFSSLNRMSLLGLPPHDWPNARVTKQDSGHTANPSTQDPKQLAIMLTDFSSRFDTDLQSTDVESDANSNRAASTRWCIAALVTHSLIGFVVIILAPLLIITVCNISIYSIVKVHERRLSTSSGSNLATSTSKLNGHRQQSLRREPCADERSDCDSLTSIIVSRLAIKMGLKKGPSRWEDLETCDRQACLVCNNMYTGTGCGCKQTSVPLGGKMADDIDSVMVNRSGRLVSRQDSYQLISKLRGHELAESSAHNGLNKPSKTSAKTQEDDQAVKNETIRQSASLVEAKFIRQSNRVKRKTSDHRLTFALSRKDSNMSQPDERYIHQQRANMASQVDADIGVWFDSPQAITSDKYDSVSIMNQLKLAGLSFAGIAINNSANVESPCHRALNRSSSCSLGNLSVRSQAVHHGQCHECFGGDGPSRCSARGGDSGSIRRSYVTISESKGRHDEKYSTRLIEIDEPSGQHPHGPSMGNYSSGHRLPFSIGTKSAAFNVIIWLILTMLVFTLPQFLMVTINQILQLDSSESPAATPSNKEHLLSESEKHKTDYLVRLIFAFARSSPLVSTTDLDGRLFDELGGGEVGSGHNLAGGEHLIVRMSSIWLSCFCRILFITMVPINSWLYGIRSRSLRMTIKMVLKRYISRRQASIEISQRHRSSLTMKSRDSSFATLPSLGYAANGITGYHAEAYQCHDSPKSVFRRCSSLTGVRRDFHMSLSHLSRQFQRHNHKARNCNRNRSFDSSTNASDCSEISQSAAVHHNSSSIKFVIGDCGLDRESDGASPTNIAQQSHLLCSSPQTSSVTSSLSSSNRSLISSIAHSPNSTYKSVFERRANFCSDQKSSVDTRSRLGQRMESQDDGQATQADITSESDRSTSTNFEPRSLQSERTGTMTLVNNPENSSIGNSVGTVPASQRRKSFANERNCYSNFTASYHDSDNKEHAFASDDFEADAAHQKGIQTCDDSGQFKFLITGADHETDELNLDSKHPLIEEKAGDRATKEAIAQAQCLAGGKQSSHVQTITHGGEGNDQHKDANQSGKIILGWCKSLRHHLARMFANASVGFIAGHMIDDGTKRHSLKSSNDTPETSSCLLDSSMAARCEEPYEKGASNFPHESVARKCSLDSHCQNLWRSNPLNGQTKSSSNEQMKSKIFRKSITMNNVTGFACPCHQHQSGSAGSDQNHSTSSSSSVDQQPTGYLKPPNFLKLLLDSEMHPMYSSSSALSPIKECSSNHSFASSRSSLNNNTSRTNSITKNPSIIDPNKVSERRGSSVDSKTNSKFS